MHPLWTPYEIPIDCRRRSSPSTPSPVWWVRPNSAARGWWNSASSHLVKTSTSSLILYECCACGRHKKSGYMPIRNFSYVYIHTYTQYVYVWSYKGTYIVSGMEAGMYNCTLCIYLFIYLSIYRSTYLSILRDSSSFMLLAHGISHDKNHRNPVDWLIHREWPK